ncbi:hypothetical protein SteCoe_20255 [Stentor coeruleus]|uniref:Uncharacterized protein n=1 Tax=Stentor coeruleus TaxID=5963 RepID=A0A1R2BSP7_9CILI|nr:hypothetical protein SteCoe_20255 [Stentor coeruleus]
MSILNTSYKSPMKCLFTSAFKREDIKTAKLSNTSSDATHGRSQSCTRNFLFTNDASKQFDDDKSDLNLKENITRAERTPMKDVNYSFKSLNKTENSEVKQNACNFEYGIEMKYEDLSRRYERMQEFYKTQVSRLTDEVSHYKTLYNKLLIQHSNEKKMIRRNY